MKVDTEECDVIYTIILKQKDNPSKLYYTLWHKYKESWDEDYCLGQFCNPNFRFFDMNKDLHKKTFLLYIERFIDRYKYIKNKLD